MRLSLNKVLSVQSRVRVEASRPGHFSRRKEGILMAGMADLIFLQNFQLLQCRKRILLVDISRSGSGSHSK